MSTRKKLAAAVLSLALFSTSCIGPNKLFNGLNEWNQSVTETDWVNELIFVGFHIIPVYGVTYFVDIVVMNTIDYWSE